MSPGPDFEAARNALQEISMMASRNVSAMKQRWVLGAALFLVAAPFARAQQPPASGQAPRPAGGRFSQPDPIDFDDHEGWKQIFNGKDLTGWDGPPDVWHYADGAIVGESSPEHPSGTTNIIWRGGEPANFKLKLEIKLEGTGANGGIQYRSRNVPPAPRQMPPTAAAQMTPEQKQRMEQADALNQKHAKWNMEGYQADADFNNRYTGQLYEQGTSRGIVAWRGQVVETVGDGRKPRLLATVGTPEELATYIKPGEWNQMEIIADGNTLTHIINGHVMSILVDTDPKFEAAKGLIGLEIEGGGVLKISHRSIWLKELP
jgi:hypothetical protein